MLFRSRRIHVFKYSRELLKEVTITMRRKLAIIFLVLGIIFGVENNNTTQANVAVGFNLFFGTLSPYGNWVSVPTYGNVWHPTAVGPHWRPYTDGRWVWGQITDGHGFLMNPGAGRHTTMEDGHFLIITVGYGYRGLFGHLLGLLGMAVLATSGGLLLPLITTSSFK